MLAILGLKIILDGGTLKERLFCGKKTFWLNFLIFDEYVNFVLTTEAKLRKPVVLQTFLPCFSSIWCSINPLIFPIIFKWAYQYSPSFLIKLINIFAYQSCQISENPLVIFNIDIGIFPYNRSTLIMVTIFFINFVVD